VTEGRKPLINGTRPSISYLERETGIEPATLCLEALGFAIRIWRNLISAISGCFEPLSPEAMTLKLQGFRPGVNASRTSFYHCVYQLQNRPVARMTRASPSQ